MVLVSTVACSRQKANQSGQEETSPVGPDPGFPIPESGSLVLMLDQNGEFQSILATADTQDPFLDQGPEPAPFAIQTAIAALQAPIDDAAIIAINRSGLVYLTVQNRRVQLHRIEGAAEEFAGRSVAQAWTWNRQAMFLLHRNEIFEPETARRPSGLIIAANADGARVLPGFKPDGITIDQGESELFGSPYALFPRARNRWLVQFRLVGPEHTNTGFASWNPDQSQLKLLDRNEYENAVKPVPMSEAPDALRIAADALGNSLILEAVMPDGSHQTWLRGNVDSIRTARALVSDSGVISLASDGRLVMVEATMIHELDIDRPVPQASFRDLALLDGFIIAVWEENLFPDIGRSGLIIIDVSQLYTRSSQSDL